MRKVMKKVVSLMVSASLLTSCALSFNSFSASAKTVSNTYCYHDYGASATSYHLYRLSLDTLENSASTRSIYGDVDRRVPDPNNTAVVRLSVGGTGFIVGDHTIATAAHCVYSEGKFLDTTAQIVDGNGNGIKQLTTKRIHISNDTRLDNENELDYAMIEVEEDLSSYGAFSLGIMMDDFRNKSTNITMSVSGFPQRTGEEWGKRYVGKGRILAVKPTRLEYDIDMSNGQSGGPIYREFTEYGETYKVAVGVNVAYSGSDGERMANIGIRFTPTILQFYLNNTSKVYSDN